MERKDLSTLNEFNPAKIKLAYVLGASLHSFKHIREKRVDEFVLR